MTDTPVRFDVKAFIASQAEESGMTSEDAVQFAEKCYDGMPMVIWQPYGGAKSFEEIDTQRAAQQYEMNVNMLTGELQGIITNTMSNTDMSAGDKSAAIKEAATEYESRMADLDVSKAPATEGTKTLKGTFLEGLKGLVGLGEKRDVSTSERKTLAKKGEALPDGSFPIASVGDLKNAIQAIGRAKNPSAAKAHIKKMARKLGATDSLPEGWKSNLDLDEESPLGQNFKMFVDQQGDLRWVSFSSNAFEDHSKEVFSTKALEDAVAWHDQQADRGPLRIFHVEGADIGRCDFQAVQGRFLIESGTFDNTPMGQKAVQYFEEHPDEEWQISVGYWYKEGDDADGYYDWVRWKERSVLPAGRADNPYTGFWTNLNKLGEKVMHQAAKETLTKLVGEDLAQDFITRADTATKELEASGVRFKEMKDDDFGEITDVEVLTPEGEKAAEPVYEVISHAHGTQLRHKHRVMTGSEHDHTITGGEKSAKFQHDVKAKMDAEDKVDKGADEDTENADGSKKTGSKEALDPGYVKIAEVLADLSAQVADLSALAPAVKELQEGVKTLNAADEDRMSSFLTTRATLPGGVRPSSLNTNLVDGTKEGIKEIVADGDGAPVNPAQVYVEDLFGKNNSAVRIQQG